MAWRGEAFSRQGRVSVMRVLVFCACVCFGSGVGLFGKRQALGTR